MGQLCANSRQGDREVNRLGQIIVCSHFQGFDDVVALILCRDHNDRQLNRRIGFAQGLQSVQAGDFRHFDIEQYQVNAFLFDSRQQFSGAVCQPDNIAFAGQPPGQHVSIHFVVVNDKQPAGTRVHDGFFSAIRLSIFSLNRSNSMGLVS